MVPAGRDSVHRGIVAGRSSRRCVDRLAGADEARGRRVFSGHLADATGRALPRRPALGRRLDDRYPELPGRPICRHARARPGDLPARRNGAGAAPVPEYRKQPASPRPLRGDLAGVSRARGRRPVSRAGISRASIAAGFLDLHSREDGRQPALHGRSRPLSARLGWNRRAERQLDAGPFDVGLAARPARIGPQHDRPQDRAGGRARSLAPPRRQRPGSRVRFDGGQRSHRHGTGSRRGAARHPRAGARVRETRKRVRVSRI